MDEFEWASADLNEEVITPNTLVTTMIDRMESMTIGIFDAGSEKMNDGNLRLPFEYSPNVMMQSLEFGT